MSDIDEFSRSLLEEAKRFLEKAKDATGAPGETAYLHAGLALGFCALEAHINAIADDFLTRDDLPILERSILAELDYKLEHGEFTLTQKLKMYRLEDRYEFLYRRFSGAPVDKSSSWWPRLKASLAGR